MDTSGIIKSDSTVEREPKEALLQFFAFSHLPDHLQTVSKPFHDLANDVIANLPRNPERTVALRKLIEAKDCAVRAMLYR
jgi:ferritin-like protein